MPICLPGPLFLHDYAVLKLVLLVLDRLVQRLQRLGVAAVRLSQELEDCIHIVHELIRAPLRRLKRLVRRGEAGRGLLAAGAIVG